MNLLIFEDGHKLTEKIMPDTSTWIALHEYPRIAKEMRDLVANGALEVLICNTTERELGIEEYKSKNMRLVEYTCVTRVPDSYFTLDETPIGAGLLATDEQVFRWRAYRPDAGKKAKRDFIIAETAMMQGAWFITEDKKSLQSLKKAGGIDMYRVISIGDLQSLLSSLPT
jgi:predicted nucleic acid-binding protein